MLGTRGVLNRLKGSSGCLTCHRSTPIPTSVSSSALSLRSQPSLLVLSYPGSSQMSGFGVAPLAAVSQPNSLADVGGLLGARMAAGSLPGRWVQTLR